MQLRHISPRSIDWVDAMDEGAGRGREKLTPEELSKLRIGAQAVPRGEVKSEGKAEGAEGGDASDDYGWRAGSASR